MAFFKFRWPGQGEQQQAEKPSKRPRTPQGESIEVMRRRARHRLIGAAVLVLLGVIGFPLLFDTQPRPIPVDIPIEIPDRNKVAPLVVPAPVAEVPAAKPAAPVVPQAAAVTPRLSPSRSAAANGLSEGEELVQGTRPAVSKPASVAAAPVVAPKPEVKHDTKPPVAPAPEPKPTRTDDSLRARALLEGRSAESAPPAVAGAEDGRFIVQVGAFADADKAREARAKVERSGLKTYTQVVDTKDGKRTRVRVGPFTNRVEADKAAARIKALDLSASVLTL
ncbi:DedD protein [Acidovorax sp. 69]|uniref:SPOR domain-containing protein n=1 Tax=Acidovorax sp. 69 TaxID=2035202 RepID=UPI000C23180C|nr:SPOR domain-containing protein [Acidovorax sp. 69]PJI97325.1 DedD protein [Acidovorax sp. 69]